jgi:2-dehydro-3-deoxyphosphogluconate aldolase/(4S)-4-hydroxy-2-oxoglutarate aldolase
MDLTRFRSLPLMGILRGGDVSVVDDLIPTLIRAGLETLEITLNTREAPAMIRRAREVAGDALMIGAGTVLDRAGVIAALEAGAGFIVSPVLVAEVMAECRSRGVPAFPGALTPQEIFAAAAAGAAMVKVFPASVFGPSYFREVRGPFEGVELLACGGVRPSNCAEYFAAGAAAVAFGGSVFSLARFAARDYESIGRDVSALVSATRSAASATRKSTQAGNS